MAHAGQRMTGHPPQAKTGDQKTGACYDLMIRISGPSGFMGQVVPGHMLIYQSLKI